MANRLVPIWAAATLLATGCAPFNYGAYEAALDRGDCDAAVKEMTPAANQGNAAAINNIGLVYERCYGDQAKAIGFYTLAARKGDEIARQNLVKLDQPVPPSDLANSGTNSNGNDAGAAVLQGMSDGLHKTAESKGELVKKLQNTDHGQVDQNCLKDCLNRGYMFQLCENKCSF